MRMVGLEPTRGRPRKILSLVRLPFRHIRVSETPSVSNDSLIITYFFSKVNTFFQVAKKSLQETLTERFYFIDTLLL